MKSLEIKTECAICHQIKDKDTGKYHNISPEERRNYYEHNGRVSHGFCPDCYLVYERKQMEFIEKAEGERR